MRSHVDTLRPVLGIVFLAGYVWQTFAPESWGTDLFLGVSCVVRNLGAVVERLPQGVHPGRLHWL